MKHRCKVTNCLRKLDEPGICDKCQKRIKQGVKKRKTKPKEKSSRSHPKALREAKAAFQKLRRLQESDVFGIVVCVGGQRMHWSKCDGGHYIPAKKMNTCFDPMNVNPQSKSDNMNMNNPVVSGGYTDWMIHRYGKDAVDALIARSYIKKKYSTIELIEMKKQFDSEIEELLKRY